ncbi:MAG: RNA polymerase factor sigma-54, partial [Euryarchaeota archaeon]|nr:RNA polymerase factor sigma-54 [Euryarchaeota archaeon]
QMPLLKLKEFIERQIEENPLVNAEKDKEPELDFGYNFDDEEKKNYRESLITKPATLQEHLLRQLHLFTGSDDERKIGELIIGNIDDNGYLGCSVEEISESNKTPVSEVEKILFLIQTFDPIGIGARNLRECLLIQLKAKGRENSLAWQIIDKYLPDLEKKRFDYIAKKTRTSVEKIKEAMKEIANLEPKPGRCFNDEKAIHLIPDAVLKKDKDKYEVIFNDWELPRISLNDKYKKMIKQKDTPQDAREFLKERLKAARSLIEAVNKRKETIQKVTEAIVYVQKDFLDKGEAQFKPMTLSQIANMVGKHKSTVSRAISNKYVQTPYGIFELRNFLNSGVKQETGEFLSSKTIKSKIKNLIENEGKENPLTDQKITERLKQQGISISRRTVAKYRDQLKILPSQSRRE